jgi:hypothetical protein
MKLCQVTDYSNPLYDGPVVYPNKNKSCGHWGFGEEVVDSKEMTIGVNSRSSVYDDQTLLNWCNRQAVPTRVNTGALSFWQNGEYLPDNVTQKWVLRDHRIEGEVGFCRLELVNQPVKEDAICGAEPDLKNGKPSFSGYGQKSIYALSCGTEARTLPYGSSLTTILSLDSTDKLSASCATNDGSALNTDAEVVAKAALLNKEMLAAMRLDASTCAYKLNLAEYTKLFLQKKSASIATSQQSFLTSVSNLLAKKCQ